MKLSRLELIAILALALVTVPLTADAQPAAKVYRIGLLGSRPPTAPEAAHLWEAFVQGLRELGYVEGQNILIESRYYGDRTEQLPALAAELVRLNVDVIVAGAAPAPEAAQRATSTIPIVMASHPDPVGSGLVASLARPGRNVTGLCPPSLRSWSASGCSCSRKPFPDSPAWPCSGIRPFHPRRSS